MHAITATKRPEANGECEKVMAAVSQSATKDFDTALDGDHTAAWRLEECLDLRPSQLCGALRRCQRAPVSLFLYLNAAYPSLYMFYKTPL